MTISSPTKRNPVIQVVILLTGIITLLAVSIAFHKILGAWDDRASPAYQVEAPGLVLPATSERLNTRAPTPPDANEDMAPKNKAPQAAPDIQPPGAPMSSSPQYISLPDKYAYRQDDDRWRLDALGYSRDRMQDYGCTVTAVANAISNLSGQSMTPQELNDKLAPAGGYTNRSWLIWDKIQQVTNGDITVEYYDTFDHASIGQCMGDGGYPVIKIKLASGIIHWVLIVAQTKNDYLIRDPLVGSRTDKPIYLSTRTDGIQALRCVNKTN